MILQTAVREIAEKLCDVSNTNSYPYIRQEQVESACYAAIRAFAEQEPSADVQQAGLDALADVGLRPVVAKKMCCAMLAQAVKELDQSLASNPHQNRA